MQSRPGDFMVDEIPTSDPGPTTANPRYLVVTLEKTDRNTRDVLNELGARLRVAPRDIGFSGATERCAVALQRISLPARISAHEVLACRIRGVRVLRAEPAEAPVRAADVRARRYVVVIRRTSVSPTEAKRRARAVLDRLGEAPFVPNWFGDARFGVGFANAARGRALVLGFDPVPRVRTIAQRRQLICTYQAYLFNEYLARRIADGLFGRVIRGDLLISADSEALHESRGTDEEQARVSAGVQSITGPLFGARMPSGASDSEAARRERSGLEEDEMEIQQFAKVVRVAPGSRRSIAVRVQRSSVETTPDGLRLELDLPRASYVAAIVREIIKDAGRAAS